MEMILRITGKECKFQDNYCGTTYKKYECFCCKGQRRTTLQSYINGNYENQYQCEECGAGSFEEKENHYDRGCTSCPIGTYHSSNDIGKSSCTACAIGTYGFINGAVVNRYPGWTLDYICKPCEAGKFSGSDQETPRSSCSPCAAGTVSGAGSQTCSICNSGKYQDETGKAECKTCGAGTYTPTTSPWNLCKKCEAGKAQSSDRQTSCNECVAGKYQATEGVNKECTLCEQGKYIDKAAATICLGCHQDQYQPDTGKSKCETCASGKYAEGASNPTAPGALSCSECAAGKYMNPLIPRRVPCLDCEYSCPIGQVLAGCIPTTNSSGKCMNCGIGHLLNISSAECQSCPVDTFQNLEKHTQLTCQKCPFGSSSPEGSISVDKCKCYIGFVRIIDQGRTVCGCEQGNYINSLMKCEACPLCRSGQYNSGCTYQNPGKCMDCNTNCPDGKALAGCGAFSAGECKSIKHLVPTPQCPVDADDPFKSRSTGYGLWDFESVFRDNKTSVDFRCSDVCDGAQSYDSQECDGPYACNMRTCAENIAPTGAVIPVRACPVIITKEDTEDVIESKRRQKCVPCMLCGHDNDAGRLTHSDWGAGCARECSQLMCDEGGIWDWTLRRCSTCGSLRDIRLCHKDDIEEYNLETSMITGNWPLLVFRGCRGSGAKLLTEVGVGRCHACDKRGSCTARSEFPESCRDDSSVDCGLCQRERESSYISVLKGRWLDAGTVPADLHCQITACKSRNNLEWTGVHRDGKLCMQKCVDTTCPGDQVLLPCRLPQQARCERGFPTLLDVAPTMLLNQQFAGEEVNLLNEGDTEFGRLHRRFTSFENVLIVLNDLDDYQCVWNADGITDNTATPGGISHVFWSAGQSNDDTYKMRGTRVCRVWDVASNVEMPLLPLQNTVSCNEEEDRASHCLDRRMLVNTEAYVISYGFRGLFGLEQMDDLNIKWLSTDKMLQAADIGGSGQVYLMLRMHQQLVKVAVDVPIDRSLHGTSWLHALLVSFTVVDVTEYEKGSKMSLNVRVWPQMAIAGQIISNQDNMFIPELFWSQPMHNASSMSDVLDIMLASGEDFVKSNSSEHETSLFQVYTENWFSDWTPCSPITVPASLYNFEIAPSLNVRASETGLCWLNAEHGSATMYDVLTSCFPASACISLKDIVDVFVLRRQYTYTEPVNSMAYCSQTNWTCSITSDLMMLGFRHLHNHMPDIPVVDRHTADGAERVVYKLKTHTFAVNVQQMNTGNDADPYSQCSVLATSFSTIECIGADRITTLHRAEDRPGIRFITAFTCVVGGQNFRIVLRAEATTFSGVLEWYSHDSYAGYDSKSSPMSTSPASDVHNSSVLAKEWVSVAVQGENVTALCLTNSETNTLSVRFYKLQWDNYTKILALEAQSGGELIIPGKWTIDQNNEDPWIRFCTLASPREATHLLVACVQQIPNRELTPFILRVCVGDRLAPENSLMAGCTEHDLSLPEGEMPSFLSTSFLRQDKMNASLLWVVGVKGEIFGVTSSIALATSTVSVYKLLKSDLQFKHFVKVDHVFVTFSVSTPTSPSVLTYLPKFERWNLKSVARVPTAYAVLIVPREATEVENVVTFLNSQNVLETSQARRNITILQASYIVQKNGEAALPVYERTEHAVVADDTTELLMSTHKVSPSPPGPSSFLARYSQTLGSPDAASGVLNRALGIPFALGRHEQRDEECVFMEWQEGKLVTALSPKPDKLTASVTCGSMGNVVGSTTENNGVCPMCISSSRASSGSITGSTNVDTVNNYIFPIHCYWLVTAQPNVEIQVQFTDLHVNPYTPVKIYECVDASCASCAYCGPDCYSSSCANEIELTGQYEIGWNLKKNHIFASKSGYLKIAFHVRNKNDFVNYRGFSLQWTLRRLPSTTTMELDPALCVNDQYEGYVVSGANCNQESEIEGLYTYDAAASTYYTEGKPVYARRNDINYSSPFTNPLKRYLYYHKDYGWLIGFSTVNTPPMLGTCDIDAVSGDLRSHDYRCGGVRAALKGKGPRQFPPVNVFWSEWCKVPGAADYTPFNSMVGARALKYQKIYQNLTLTPVPRCPSPPVYRCPGDSGLIDNTKKFPASTPCGFPGASSSTCECSTGNYGEIYTRPGTVFSQRFCRACPKGTYQDEVGFIESCKPCPQGCTTLIAGANSESVCVSPPTTTTPAPTTPPPTTPPPTTPPPAGPATGLVLGLNTSRWERLRGAEPWLLLQFTVPCGKRLRPYKRGGTACGLADVEGLEASSQFEPDCPPHEHVVALLDATLERETTVYHLRQDGSVARLVLEACDCIFMQAGVFWVDATIFRDRPSELDIRSWLVSPTQKVTNVQPAPLVDTWRRERHVLQVMPRERMRLELLFERGVTDARASVGVDDVQLTPLLSSFPAVRGSGGRQCARVRVPELHELAQIGLQSLFLGNHTISQDDWERVQGTVSLDVQSKDFIGCRYTVKISLVHEHCAGDESGQGGVPGGMDGLGCELELTSGGMQAYDECQIELPAYLSQDYGNGIGLVLTPAVPGSSCELPDDSLLFMSLRPNTKLYSCPLGEYLHASGKCFSCHRPGVHELCVPGFRTRGCPALEPASEDNCVQCEEGRDLVERGVAEYVANVSSEVPCQWKCREGFFVSETLGARECLSCSQTRSCEPGQRWQDCTPYKDGDCVPCSDLWLTKGPYADNEEYYDPNDTCKTRCKSNFFLSRLDSLCKQCWDKTQLLLMAGVASIAPGPFYAFRNCSALSNTQILPCIDIPGTEVIDSDPSFTGDCRRICKKGWTAVGNICTKCENPPLIINGVEIHNESMPENAFEWKPNSPDYSSACDFECKHPYQATWLHTQWNPTVHKRTCVLCSEVCRVGEYPRGPYCECAGCTM